MKKNLKKRKKGIIAIVLFLISAAFAYAEYPGIKFTTKNEIVPSVFTSAIPSYDEFSDASTLKAPDYLPKQFKKSGTVITLNDVSANSMGPAEPMKVIPGGEIIAQLKGTKLYNMNYQFLKVVDYNNVPAMPAASDSNWKILENATGAAVTLTDWERLYPDLIKNKNGYITVQHYNYTGNYGGSTPVPRYTAFSSTISTPMFKTAIVRRNGFETYNSSGVRVGNGVDWWWDSAPSPFFLPTNVKYNINPYKFASYNEQPGNTAFFDPGYVGTPGPDGISGTADDQKTLAAKKAMKLWGYICPIDVAVAEATQVPSTVAQGSLTLNDAEEIDFSFFADDGAYAYIYIDGVKTILCDNWVMGVPSTRWANTSVKLKKGVPYPIYMEWFEGHYTEGGFKIQYKKKSETVWKDVPSKWFYPSGDNTPAKEEAYFTPPKALYFPPVPGYYYLASIATNERGITSTIATRKIMYGPFEVIGLPKMNLPVVTGGYENIKVTYLPLTSTNTALNATFYETAYKKELPAANDTETRGPIISSSALQVNLTPSHGIELYSSYYFSVRGGNSFGTGKIWSDEGIGAATSNRIDKIEGEWYDLGGQDVGYNDTDARTGTNTTYRPGDMVDMDDEATSSNGKAVVVKAGEWLRYTREIGGSTGNAAGVYKIEARVKSALKGNSFRILLKTPSGSIQNVENTVTTFDSTGGGYTVIEVGKIYLRDGINQIYIKTMTDDFSIDHIGLSMYSPAKNTEPPFQTVIYPIAGGNYNEGFYEMDSMLDNKLKDMGTGTFSEIKLVEMTSIDELMNTLVFSDNGDFEFDKDYRLWKKRLGDGANCLMITKPITVGTTDFYESLALDERVKKASFHYEDKLNTFTKTEDGDKVSFTWNEPDPAHTGRYLVKEKMMFRITKKQAYENYSYTRADNPDFNTVYNVSIPQYMYDIKGHKNPLNLVEEGAVGNGKVAEFLNTAATNKYIDLVYTAGKSNIVNNVGFNYTNGEFQVIGLPIGEYTIQIYSVKMDFDGKFKVVNYEYWADFKSDIPSIFTDPIYINQTDFYLIDNIDKSDFPNVKVNFLTKTKAEIDENAVSGANVVPIAAGGYPVAASGVNLQEWNKNKTVDTLNPLPVSSTLAAPVQLRPSDLEGFKFPIDIVFVIDSSGSMQNSIYEVRDKVPWISEELIKRGYAVRYNLVAFGPNSDNTGGYTPIFSKTNVEKNAYGNNQTRQTIKQYRERFFGVTTSAGMDTIDPVILKGDADEFSKALNKLVATGSYSPPTGFSGRGQENGYGGIMRAIEILRTNGRSLNANRQILNNNTGVVPSLKWIITITDENFSLESLPNETTLYTNIKNAMIQKDTSQKEMNINLNAVCHVLQPATGTPYWAYGLWSGMDLTKWYKGDYDYGGRKCYAIPTAIGVTNGKPTKADAITKDVLGNDAVFSSDTDGPYYPKLKELIATGYDYYELGYKGERLGKTLETITFKAGMMARWVLTYKSPFSEKDGTTRQVNFGLQNMKLLGTTSAISLKDVNYIDGSTTNTLGSAGSSKAIKLREYTIERLNVQIESRNPANTTSDNPLDITTVRPKFTEKGTNVEVIFYAKATKMTATGLVEDSIVEARVSIAPFDNTATGFNSAGIFADKVLISATADNDYLKKIDLTPNFDAIDKEHEPTKWYKVQAVFPKTAFFGKDYFDVRLFAKTSDQYLSTIVKKVGIANNPAKITAIKVENMTLNTSLAAIKKRPINGAATEGELVFSADDVAKYSKLEYDIGLLRERFSGNASLDYADYDFSNPIDSEIPLSDKVITNDGEYSKNGDKLKVTIEFFTDNINHTNYSANYLTSGAKDVIAANFVDVTNVAQWTKADTVELLDSDYEIPVSSAAPTLTVKMKKYRATWNNIGVNVAIEGIKKMNIGIINSAGVDTKTATVDNKIISAEISKAFYGSHETRLNASITNQSTNGNLVVDNYYTNKPNLEFSIGSSVASSSLATRFGGSVSAPADGIRYLKVYYLYDRTESDLTTASMEGASKENAPEETIGGTTYKYYCTADINSVILNFDGKKDDGKYNVYFRIVERAGVESNLINMSEIGLKNSATNNILNIYADHEAPRILNGVTKKMVDGLNNPILNHQILKNGDEARVEFRVQEFNIPNTGLECVPYFRTSTTGTPIYLDYRQLINSGWDPGIALINQAPVTTGASTNMKQFDLEGGAKGSAANTVKNFKVDTTNPDGNYKLIVGARDLAGNMSTYEITATLDNTKPVFNGKLTLIPLEVINSGAREITGTLQGASVNLNGQTVSTTASTLYKTTASAPDITRSQEMANVVTLSNLVSATNTVLQSETNYCVAYSKHTDMFIGTDQLAVDTNGIGIAYYKVNVILNGGTPVSYSVPKDAFENEAGLNLAEVAGGGFINNSSLVPAIALGDKSIAVGKYGSLWQVTITAVDFGGSESDFSQNTNWSDPLNPTKTINNALIIDQAVNNPGSPIVMASGGGSGVTLVTVGTNLRIGLNLSASEDSSGILAYRLVSIKSESGTNVSSANTYSETVGTAQPVTRNNGSYVTSSNSTSMPMGSSNPLTGDFADGNVPLKAKLNLSSIAPSDLRSSFKNRIIEVPISANASFIGGKVKVTIEIMDHLGNTALVTRDFLVQRGGINIRSQDTKSNKQITTEINMGEEGSIQRRIEGGRQ